MIYKRGFVAKNNEIVMRICRMHIVFTYQI